MVGVYHVIFVFCRHRKKLYQKKNETEHRNKIINMTNVTLRSSLRILLRSKAYSRS